MRRSTELCGCLCAVYGISKAAVTLNNSEARNIAESQAPLSTRSSKPTAVEHLWEFVQKMNVVVLMVRVIKSLTLHLTNVSLLGQCDSQTSA